MALTVQWIPVKDKLPKMSEKVVCFDGDHMFVAYLSWCDETQNIKEWIDNKGMKRVVTHWQEEKVE